MKTNHSGSHIFSNSGSDSGIRIDRGRANHSLPGLSHRFKTLIRQGAIGLGCGLVGLAAAQMLGNAVRTEASVQAVANRTTAGNMCLGDLRSSICLNRGWEHLSAAGAWDESVLAAGFDPSKLEAIDHLYQSVLGRRVDKDGLKTYSRALAEGWSMSRVRRDLANSPEAELALHTIYRDLLARNADPEGLATYRDRLKEGWGLYRIRLDVATSSEARLRRRLSSVAS